MTVQRQKQARAIVVVILCLLFLAAVSNILHASGNRDYAQGFSQDVTGTEHPDRNKSDTEYNVQAGSETENTVRGTQAFLTALKRKICDTMMPFLTFSKESVLADNAAEAVFLHVGQEFPLLYYIGLDRDNVAYMESSSLYEMILALEGADEDQHSYFEDIDSKEAMELENQALREDQGDAAAADSAGLYAGDMAGAEGLPETDDILAQVNQENAAAGGSLIMGSQVTLRTAPAFYYDFSVYQDLDSLVKGFYIVDSSTSVNSERLNLDSLLHTDVTIHGDNTSPQILIYHTHSQEGYADSVEGDISTGVVGAGEYLAEILHEQYGYYVIHHTGQYDVEVRDQAYAAAEPAIEQLLSEYPTIEVVIDLHRDEVKEGVHLVADIDGVSCAKFMFFNGLSYSNTIGDISYLYNPHREENLAFSFQAQVLANEYYPGITRGIYLRAYRYNMHFVGKNMLLELGAQSNTREEVWNTVPIIAQVLDMVFRGE